MDNYAFLALSTGKVCHHMKNLRRKKITVIIYLVIACIVMAAATIGSYFYTVITNKAAEADSQVESFMQTYNSMLDKSYLAYQGYNEDLASRARLYAAAAKEEPEDLEPRKYGDGYIVQIEGEKIITPDGYPKDKADFMMPEFFTAEYEAWDANGFFVSYAHIDGPFYYIEYPDAADYEDGINDMDISGALSNLANANGCDYLYIGSADLTEDTYIIAGTNDFAQCETIAEIGLNKENIESLNTKSSIVTNLNGSIMWIRRIHYEDEYSYADIIMLVDLKKVFLGSLQQSVMILIIVMIILILLCVWIFSVYEIVRSQVLNEEQRILYNPKTLQRKMLSVMAASLLVVFISSSFIISLDCLFIESSSSEDILNEYIDRIKDDEIRAENIWQQSQSRYITTARQLAVLIDEHRDLQNARWLREAAKIIEADYIIIYDTNGDEVISSDRYRGMSLGKDKESATYDFRRLLRGVSYISHSGLKDEITGLTRDMHGISLRYLSNEKSYGALIIVVDPKQHIVADFTDIAETTVAMSPVYGFIAGVDPNTGEIVYSSNETLGKANMRELCSELKEYTGAFMGFVDIGGTDYYIRSAEHDGIVYYCGIKESEMFSQVLPRAYRTTYRFLLLAAILIVILLYGYDQKTFNEYAGKEVGTDHKRDSLLNPIMENAQAATDLTRKQSAFMKQSYLIFRQEGLSPGERVKGTLQFLILIATVLMSAFVFLDKSGATGSSGSDDVIEYIAHGNWNRGFNLFSIAAILFLVCILVVGLYILKSIAGVLYLTMDTDSRTTMMLLINILQYIAIIVVLFFSLGYLGVNTRALVASAGLAGIAISLGAKDLIADIIAGIMILVDNTYNVGEIIEVDGFRGEVAEIGMRSTKIIGRGDNVKTIRNSSIGDVINFSRLNSWYPLLLTISSTQSLSEIEAMLAEELPKISENHPEMIRGPEYRGVDSISGDKTSILILTECREEDYNKVQREVNREVHNLFKEHHIDLF